MADYRAMCSEMLEAFDGLPCETNYKGQSRPIVCIDEKPFIRARALLAQPEPEGPTDQELLEMWHSCDWFDEGATLREFISIARAVLARWGNSQAILDSSPQPVAVSERPWARKGWCDEQGRCWIYMPDIGTDPSWRLADPRYIGPYHTHCLPANALPTPEAAND